MSPSANCRVVSDEQNDVHSRNSDQAGTRRRDMDTTLEVEARATVYVIDDDDGFRRSMLRALSVAGLQGVGYGSAGDFLIDRVKEQCEEESACILLDITMPGPSGIELMRALAARETSPPIIFVTGRDDILTS